MPKTIHTATGPNGESFKRTSATRVYSHCIAARPSLNNALRRANDPLAQAQDGSNWEFYKRQAERTMDDKPSWKSEESFALELAKSKDEFAAIGSKEEYIRAQHQARLDGIEKAKAEGFYESWNDIGWASRPDLADKAAAAALTGGYWLEARTFEASRIVK